MADPFGELDLILTAENDCGIVFLFIYLFIYLRAQHSKQYKIEDTIKAAKF